VLSMGLEKQVIHGTFIPPCVGSTQHVPFVQPQSSISLSALLQE